MSDEHYAKEASRLLADETLKRAFEAVCQTAMSDLVTVDADDKTAILRLQSKVQVIDEVLSELEAAIHKMAAQVERAIP